MMIESIYEELVFDLLFLFCQDCHGMVDDCHRCKRESDIRNTLNKYI